MKDKNVLIDSFRIWKSIFSYIQGSKVLFFLVVLFYAGSNTLFNFNFGLLLKNITIGALNNDGTHILWSLLFLLTVNIILQALDWFCFHTYISNSKARAEYVIRNRIFSHLLRLPLAREAEAHTGDAMSRLVTDGQTVANALSWDTVGMLWPFVNVLASGVITLFISWQIGLVTVALGLVFLFMTNKVAEPFRRNNKLIKEARSKSKQHMLDFLAGSQTVRLLGIENAIMNRFKDSTLKVKKLSMKNTLVGAWYSTVSNAVGVFTSAAVLLIGMALVEAGQLSLPNVLLVYSFSTTTVYGLMNVGNALTQFQNVAASAQRVLEVLDKPQEDRRADKAQITQNPQKQAPMLEVRDLVFRYRDELAPALNGVSFSVREGEHIALVGESGSGKSTIFKLLMEYYPPDKGAIFLYGNEYPQASMDSVRAQFAYVAQESPLFDGTIDENIAMGKRTADKEERVEAAKRANADPFITEFAKGYQEQVGELGAQISGGQRQRIAIARALLRNAPILLLDEATSSLDSQNEQLVQDALDRFAAGRTTIVAAHRLSTVQNADRILVFDKGQIAESGTHQELLEQKGIYAGLIAAQALN